VPLFCFGCGSRSELLSDVIAAGGTHSGGSAGAGGGGGGTGNAGGQGGAGGSGGLAPVCPAFDLTGAPIGFEPEPEFHENPPSLGFASADGSRVAMVSALVAVESPGPLPAYLRMASITAWNAWPSTLGGGVQSAFVAGVDQFAFDRGSGQDSLAMTWPSAPSPPASGPQGLFFDAAVSVSSGSPQNVQSIALQGPPNHVSEFVRAGSDGYLIGFQTSETGHHQFHLTRRTGAGQKIELSWLGCATNEVSGDAVALPSGEFLFAFSTSRPWGSCLDDDGIDTPAHAVLTGLVAGENAVPGPLVIDEDDFVRFVRVVPHSEGAWIAWQYEGINALTIPPVMAMRVDPQGNPLTPAIPILDGSVAGAPPAFASLGDRLAFAYLDFLDPLGGTMVIKVLDTFGQPLFERSFQSSAQPMPPKLALLASPAHDQLLLGWSEGNDGVNGMRAFLARFCVPGL
jgi:hypothetical protein